MSTVSGSSKTGALLRPPTELQLRNWPLVDDPLRGWGFIIAVVIGSVLGGWVTGTPWFTVVAAVAILLAGWRIILPVHFEIGSKGVIQSILGRRRRIPWRTFRRYEVYPRGILLLRDDATSPAAFLRGIFIRHTFNRLTLHRQDQRDHSGNRDDTQHGAPKGGDAINDPENALLKLVQYYVIIPAGGTDSTIRAGSID